MNKEEQLLRELGERLGKLEHEAELIKTVLIVKEPNTLHAADAFEGLRKAVLAGANERNSHLAQLITMSVSVNRATAVEDLRPQVAEWLEQAGVVAVVDVPEGHVPADFFEDVGGAGLDGPIDVVEPAYFDRRTSQMIRPGRAKLSAPSDPEDVTS